MPTSAPASSGSVTGGSARGPRVSRAASAPTPKCARTNSAETRPQTTPSSG
jgi:hypothetical protein